MYSKTMTLSPLNSYSSEDSYYKEAIHSGLIAPPSREFKPLDHVLRTGFPTIEEADPSGRALSEPGTKADAGKDLPWLFQTGFANALAEVAKVTTLGARKYTPNGWATVPNGSERYMEGFARHMQKLAQGEVFDNGPGGLGTYHKAQMIWNLLASLELELRGSKT